MGINTLLFWVYAHAGRIRGGSGACVVRGAHRPAIGGRLEAMGGLSLACRKISCTVLRSLP
jgi:hypothetical protein